jgi:hypothetical protein
MVGAKGVFYASFRYVIKMKFHHPSRTDSASRLGR